MWLGNARHSKRTAPAAGKSGTPNGRRFALNAGLICIAGILLWLGTHIARITVRLRQVGISTVAAR